MVATPLAGAHQALDAGETVLFEAGQATMLDVDHGTYPFVTSSSSVAAGGACTGSGVAPNADRPGDRRSHKAYTTRVGEGPFPTELLDDEGEIAARTRGSSSARRPGRPRRCGWYDARRRPLRRPAINGVTDFVLTKLDVLTGLERIPGLRRVRRRRRPVRRDAGEPDRLPPRDTRSTRSCPAGPRTSPARGRSRTCRRPRRTTSRRWRSSCGARISVIGVGPGRDEVVVRHDMTGADE